NKMFTVEPLYAPDLHPTLTYQASPILSLMKMNCTMDKHQGSMKRNKVPGTAEVMGLTYRHGHVQEPQHTQPVLQMAHE
ncbi:mCG113487, partial [Mus musculus]